MSTFGGHFAQKNAAQAQNIIVFTSTGKRRCCSLNVMVQFVPLSPDKIGRLMI